MSKPMSFKTFPITPPKDDEDRWFVARRQGSGDNDFVGVGTAEGFWRTLMEARIAAKKIMSEGTVVDRIVRSTATGRQYFLPTDAPAMIPERADTRRYYLAARGQYGGWEPTMEPTETGVGHLASDFQAVRKAKRLRGEGMRVDVILMVNRDGQTALSVEDCSKFEFGPELNDLFGMIDEAMGTTLAVYPDAGSW